VTTTARPYCAPCSRNARTVETPRVRVRVERCVVLRDASGLRLLARCHGAAWERTLPDDCTEETIEALTAFGGT
jgi:hypothetical protein